MINLERVCQNPRLVHELYKSCETMLCIIDESDGVAGFHQNGETAFWGELECVEAMEKAVTEAEGEGRQ